MTTAQTTHFAPAPRKLNADLNAVTLISVTALAGIPAFIRAEFGERALARVNQAAMLDVEMIQDRDLFVPHIVLSEFVREAARQTGVEDFGLILAPHLSLRNYGCWGNYVLGGETVGQGLERAGSSIGFHSRGDRVSWSNRNGHVRLIYESAARGREGYCHIACGAVGVMVSFCRHYLGSAWRPKRIEIDIPRPGRPGLFENIFGCPVTFDAPNAAIYLDKHELDRRQPQGDRPPIVTVEDLMRARLQRSDLSRLVGVVAEHIRAQVLAGNISIESTAHALDTSVRTLQRELNREGTDFRTLTNAVRIERAKELLCHGGVSVTQISADLGYSAPAHFTRAFRSMAGMSPREFRQQRFLT